MSHESYAMSRESYVMSHELHVTFNLFESYPSLKISLTSYVYDRRQLNTLISYLNISDGAFIFG